MLKLMIINGPNINLLGLREPEIYGKHTYDELKYAIVKKNPQVEFDFFQSNHEGDIVDYIQKAFLDKYDGIVINPAGYTHTSVAILDALKMIKAPVCEVHISQVTQREDFRKNLITTKACDHMVAGYGLNGYQKAIEYVVNAAENSKDK